MVGYVLRGDDLSSPPMTCILASKLCIGGVVMKRIIAICLLLSVVLSGCGSAAKKETTISSIAELINETQKEKPQGKKKLKWAVFDPGSG